MLDALIERGTQHGLHVDRLGRGCVAVEWHTSCPRAAPLDLAPALAWDHPLEHLRDLMKCVEHGHTELAKECQELQATRLDPAGFLVHGLQ